MYFTTMLAPAGVKLGEQSRIPPISRYPGHTIFGALSQRGQVPASTQFGLRAKDQGPVDLNGPSSLFEREKACKWIPKILKKRT